MSNIPAIVHNQLDDIKFNEQGGLLLAASSLTNRYWSGSLWYFDDPDVAPDVEKCKAGVSVDTGVNDTTWIPGTNRLVCGCDSGEVKLWELTDENQDISCLAEAAEHDGYITQVSVNANKTKLTSASQDRRIKVWDLEEFVSVLTFKAHGDSVWCASYHPTDDNVFISCSQDGKVLLWDTRKDKPASYIDTSCLPSFPTCVCWQPNTDHMVAIGTETGCIVLQDTRQDHGTPIQAYAHTRIVNKMAFAPHRPEWLASSSDDCCVTVTDFSECSAKLIRKDNRHRDFSRGVSWQPRDHSLYSCSWDFQILRHDVKADLDSESTGEAKQQSKPHVNGIENMDTLSPAPEPVCEPDTTGVD